LDIGESVLQSPNQDIDLQSNIGGGFGHFLKNTNHTTIAVIDGLAWENTRYSPSTELQGGKMWPPPWPLRMWSSSNPNKTNLTVTGTVFPAISKPGRVYTNTNVTY
jgi:hypothetical protein